MNQVLSQSEVDVLLAAVSEGELGESREGANPTDTVEANEDEKVVVAYNLTCQDKIIRGRLPRLDVIYEDFVRSFQVSLSSTLRKIVSLNHGSTNFLKFDEFINTLSVPTCISVLKFDIPHGSALFVVGRQLVYALVDNFFGGADRPYTKIEGREFTPIELSIVRRVVNLAIDDLQKAWSSVEIIDCHFVKTEVNPQLVGVIPPTDVVVVSTFDVKLENAYGQMTLVVPYSTIEPMKQKLLSKFEIEPNRIDQKIWRSTIEEQLLDIDVEVKVDLGTTSISLNQLMGLKVGDVISLDQGVAGEFDLQVETVKKYKACHEIRHGTVAVQVTKQIAK